MIGRLFGVYVCLWSLACGVSETTAPEEILTEIHLSYEDSIVRGIINDQDQFQPDSLLDYLGHRDPSYRLLAAQAFGSLKDERHVDTISTLLRDPIPEVRQAAAYALGQMGSGKAEPSLIQAFSKQDSTDANNPVNAAILEAIGKVGTASSLQLLSEVSTYQPQDHLLLLGQARAIYRYMLRGMTHPSGTQRMVQLLADPAIDRRVRLLAASYLSRADVDLSTHRDVLALAYENEADAEIKLFLPLALIKTGHQPTVARLRSSFGEQEDYRVQANAIRAMGQDNYQTYRRDIHRRLYSPNLHVAFTAAQTILRHGQSRHWREYMNLTLHDFPWQVKITLLHAVNKYIPPGNGMFRDINDQKLQQRIRSSPNLYERAAAIRALAETPSRYRYISDLWDQASSDVIRTTCASSLLHIATLPGFSRLRADARKATVDRLVLGLLSGDVGLVHITSQLFVTDGFDPAPYDLGSIDGLLARASNNLELPRDIEAKLAVERVRAQLSGTTFDADAFVEFTHPIEWDVLFSLSDTTIAEIATSKGSIYVELMPSWAPGTVANFVDLAKLNYYAGKGFHRVVPGFVIQGGCERGDGYGSLDYNVRSELGPQYFDGPGYIGMASAGNHTESTQWFITHVATPHLDGNFTIFGKVVRGMDVVHRIQVGDKIEAVNIP